MHICRYYGIEERQENEEKRQTVDLAIPPKATSNFKTYDLHIYTRPTNTKFAVHV